MLTSPRGRKVDLLSVWLFMFGGLSLSVQPQRTLWLAYPICTWMPGLHKGPMHGRISHNVHHMNPSSVPRWTGCMPGRERAQTLEHSLQQSQLAAAVKHRLTFTLTHRHTSGNKIENHKSPTTPVDFRSLDTRQNTHVNHYISWLKKKKYLIILCLDSLCASFQTNSISESEPSVTHC